MTRGRGKELILALLTVVVSVANAYLWRGALGANGFENVSLYSAPVVTLFLFAVLFSLSAIFIRKSGLRTGVGVAALAGGYLFLPFTIGIVYPLVGSAIGGWYAANRIATEEAASQLFSVRKFLQSGMPVFFTAVSLMLASFYFVQVSREPPGTFLPRSLFDATVPLIEKPLGGILPGFRTNASVDDLLLAFAAGQLGDTVRVDELPKSQKDALIQESRKALTQQFGITLTGKESVTDVLFKVTNAQLAKFIGPYKQYFPFLAAAGFFVAVKTLTLPVYWITLLLTTLVIQFLKSAGLLHERVETVQIQRLTL